MKPFELVQKPESGTSILQSKITPNPVSEQYYTVATLTEEGGAKKRRRVTTESGGMAGSKKERLTKPTKEEERAVSKAHSPLIKIINRQLQKADVGQLQNIPRNLGVTVSLARRYDTEYYPAHAFSSRGLVPRGTIETLEAVIITPRGNRHDIALRVKAGQRRLNDEQEQQVKDWFTCGVLG